MTKMASRVSRATRTDKFFARYDIFIAEGSPRYDIFIAEESPISRVWQLPYSWDFARELTSMAKYNEPANSSSERVRFLELLRTSARDLSLRYSNDVHQQCHSISYNKKAISFSFLNEENIFFPFFWQRILVIVFPSHIFLIGLFSTGAICFGRGHRDQWKCIDSHVIKTFYLAIIK